MTTTIANFVAGRTPAVRTAAVRTAAVRTAVHIAAAVWTAAAGHNERTAAGPTARTARARRLLGCSELALLKRTG